MALLVVGSIALDSVETPAGIAEDALGGSATSHFSYAASFFTPVRLVGVVGEDFPGEHKALLASRDIDTSGLMVEPGGKTFRWKGKYEGDMNMAETLETHLNVLATFDPDLSPKFAETPFVFLANGSPSMQRKVLRQSEEAEAGRRRHDEPPGSTSSARTNCWPCSARWTASSSSDGGGPSPDGARSTSSGPAARCSRSGPSSSSSRRGSTGRCSSRRTRRS